LPLAWPAWRSHVHSRRLRALFGAVERGFYLLAISWVALFGFACVTSIR